LGTRKFADLIQASKENIARVVDMAFPMCRYDRERTLNFVLLIPHIAGLYHMYISINDLKVMLSAKALTIDSILELCDILGCKQAVSSEISKLKQDRKEAVDKLNTFRDLHCRVFRESFMKSSFNSSTTLKQMEGDHWLYAMEVHEEDGKGSAVTEWLELITTIRDVKAGWVNNIFNNSVIM
jgi:hypothetical protein